MIVKRALLAVLFLALGVGSYLYRTYTRSPRYSLIQAFRAVGEHDLTGFEKYVDVEGVVGGVIDQGVDEIVKEAGAQMGAGLGPGVAGLGFPGAPGMGPLGMESMAMGMGGAMGKGLVGMIKPALMKVAKTQVASFIERGSFDESAGGRIPSAVTVGAGLELQKLLSGSGGKEIFRGIAYTKKYGKVSVVGLKFQIPEFQEGIVVDLRMRDKGDHWQVFLIDNFMELIKKFDELEVKRVAALNAPVRSAMDRALVFKGFKKTDESAAERNYSKAVTFTLDYENVGNKPINGFEARITIRKSKGDVLIEFPVKRDEVIAPGGLGIITVRKNLMIMMPRHSELYVLGAEHLKADSDIRRISFADGTDLKYHKKTDPGDFLGGF